jgi:hypothetical protein
MALNGLFILLFIPVRSLEHLHVDANTYFKRQKKFFIPSFKN